MSNNKAIFVRNLQFLSTSKDPMARLRVASYQKSTTKPGPLQPLGLRKEKSKEKSFPWSIYWL
jgi:hypothetical protein